MTLRWSHAVVYVRDLDLMVDFYSRVLGFEVTDRGRLDAKKPGSEMVFVSQSPTDHHQLAFAPVRGDGPPSTVDHMAFRVDGLDEVKAVAARVRADGRASALRPLNHGNAWSVYFRDPEGNGLEVFCDSPWHVHQPQGKPWSLEMDEDALRAQTRQQFGDEPTFRPIEQYYAERRARGGR